MYRSSNTRKCLPESSFRLSYFTLLTPGRQEKAYIAFNYLVHHIHTALCEVVDGDSGRLLFSGILNHALHAAEDVDFLRQWRTSGGKHQINKNEN